MNGHAMMDRPMTATSVSRHSPRSSAANKSLPSLDRSSLTREVLDLNRMTKIGSGIYGDVFLTQGHRLRAGEEQSLVVVKSLTVKDELLHQQLKEEMELFRKTDHPHVTMLLGICREREPILVIYEHLEYRILKHYLLCSKNHRTNGTSPDSYPPPLSIAQILSIAYQVSFRLKCLSGRRVKYKPFRVAGGARDGAHQRLSLCPQGLGHSESDNEQLVSCEDHVVVDAE